MQVEVIAATQNPMDVISMAAGVCYGKANTDRKRVERCFRNGHLSVFEHASATFHIKGISRSCMAQLTRHRHASFCVQSQRYCKYGLEGEDWFVTPEAFKQPGFVGDRTLESFYRKKMESDAKAYRDALDAGVKPEDARYLLPEAKDTELVVTMNCREFFHVLDMRWDKAAQWEVRDLVGMMHAALRDRSEQWADLMCLYSGGGE